MKRSTRSICIDAALMVRILTVAEFENISFSRWIENAAMERIGEAEFEMEKALAAATKSAAVKTAARKRG